MYPASSLSSASMTFLAIRGRIDHEAQQRLNQAKTFKSGRSRDIFTGALKMSKPLT